MDTFLPVLPRKQDTISRLFLLWVYRTAEQERNCFLFAAQVKEVLAVSTGCEQSLKSRLIWALTDEAVLLFCSCEEILRPRQLVEESVYDLTVSEDACVAITPRGLTVGR